MGELLHQALDYVMLNPSENDREALLSFVKSRIC
jgi:possible tRNA adenylyltransferase (fragment)